MQQIGYIVDMKRNAKPGMLKAFLELCCRKKRWEWMLRQEKQGHRGGESH